jgi:hypothetical protein
MNEAARASQLQAIRDFCAKNPAVLFDEPGETLLDVFSSKTLPLALTSLVAVQQRTKKGSGEPYLILAYDDGRELALADVGVAFVPDTRNTGPLEDLPDVACFRDYATLRDRLAHELFGHPDREPTRGTVLLLMGCIGIIDGARRQGFEVGREEKELQSLLEELEKRAPRLPTIP